jgi:hypothetical protein
MQDYLLGSCGVSGTEESLSQKFRHELAATRRVEQRMGQVWRRASEEADRQFRGFLQQRIAARGVAGAGEPRSHMSVSSSIAVGRRATVVIIHDQLGMLPDADLRSAPAVAATPVLASAPRRMLPPEVLALSDQFS